MIYTSYCTDKSFQFKRYLTSFIWGLQGSFVKYTM